MQQPCSAAFQFQHRFALVPRCRRDRCRVPSTVLVDRLWHRWGSRGERAVHPVFRDRQAPPPAL